MPLFYLSYLNDVVNALFDPEKHDLKLVDNKINVLHYPNGIVIATQRCAYPVNKYVFLLLSVIDLKINCENIKSFFGGRGPQCR